jgi:hypothetical protein
VTPNDVLDVDGGGNGLQNHPVLQLATTDGSTVHLVGTLNSSPVASFTLEFFASPLCDPAGFGEGNAYLGSTSVVSDAFGNAAFDVVLPASSMPGAVVTATATAESTGSTSEFSACAGLTGAPFLWMNLGQGLAGVSGVPLLTGTGSLTTSSSILWSATNGKALAPAWFVVGLSQMQLPIAGGVLVPAPDLLMLAPTGGAGAASFSPTLLHALPAGQQVFVQMWLLDPAGAAGWAASNAIAATAP